MYKGFNIKTSILDIQKLITYAEVINWVKNNEVTKNLIENKLSSFIDSNGIIDGTKLQDNWFSNANYDVFISHSHKDIELAKYLASWLNKQYKLNVFIDSCIWGYSDKLLELIDRKYCYNSNTKTYSYQKRNYTTSHIHMMLNTALMMTIDSSDLIFFLNTENSVSSTSNKDKTKSPWIYSELAITKMITKKANSELLLERRFSEKADKDIAVEYNLYLEHLKKIKSIDELQREINTLYDRKTFKSYFNMR